MAPTVPVHGRKDDIVETPGHNGLGGVAGLHGVRGRGSPACLHGAEPATPGTRVA